MSANTSPVFPVKPLCVPLSLTTAAACVSRAPTTAPDTANIYEFVPATTEGVRIDAIQVKGAATAIGGLLTAGIVGIWMNDGTKTWLIDEILVTTTITPSASVASLKATNTYSNFVLSSTQSLYASVTVAAASTANAVTVTAFGGAY